MIENYHLSSNFRRKKIRNWDLIRSAPRPLIKETIEPQFRIKEVHCCWNCFKKWSFNFVIDFRRVQFQAHKTFFPRSFISHEMKTSKSDNTLSVINLRGTKTLSEVSVMSGKKNFKRLTIYLQLCLVYQLCLQLQLWRNIGNLSLIFLDSSLFTWDPLIYIFLGIFDFLYRLMNPYQSRLEVCIHKK